VDLHLLVTLGAILIVFGYQFVMWLRRGVDPPQGTRVIRYEPPRGLSPALMRYIWKQDFDDRGLWAAALNLVAKGLLVIETKDGVSSFTAPPAAPASRRLPVEEALLFSHLKTGRKARKSKRATLDMTDDVTAMTAVLMADALRKKALGRWFNLNRSLVLPACVLSIVPVAISANPRRLDEWLGLIVSLSLMVPGGFYLLFLIRRMSDIRRSARKGLSLPTFRRGALIWWWSFVCSVSICAGFIVLGFNFGLPVVLVTALMVASNLVFLYLIKAPTRRGRVLMDEIEGFRIFLESVERFPMDHAEAPEQGENLYKRYLPYAIALEVEQAWGDRCIAFATTSHRQFPEFRAHSFYLGMWNGEPVEIVYGPRQTKDG
jgi:hypothetical protein